jgi:hypothetical protein
MIPQVDEQQAAVIPAVVQPPGESHVRTYVFGGQLTTGMAAVSMHDIPTGLDIRRAKAVIRSHEQREQGVPAA